MNTQKKQSRTLIVGPDPKRGYLGGVASHMGVMAALDVFRHASIYDPGSMDTAIRNLFTPKTIAVFVNCLLVGKARHHSHVFINTSIYPAAFIKLLIVLLSLKKTKNKKIRIFFHGGAFATMPFLKNHSMGWLVSQILKKADSIHFLSNEQGQGFELFFPEIPWELFCNYLPHNRIVLRKNTERTTLLFVGRIVREKGVFEILKAVDHLGMSNIELVFAGEGPDLDALKSAARTCKCRVKIMGRVQSQEKLNDLYSRSAMLLLPSYKEGMPYVVIESLRAGLPVITTPTGALPDMILDGINGLLVFPRQIDSLAKAIKKILDNSHLKETMIQNNFNKFTSAFSKKAAETYYSNLLTREKR